MSRALIFVSGGSTGIGAAMIDAQPFGDARVINLSRRAKIGSEHVAVDLADPAEWSVAGDAFERALRDFAGDRVVFVHSAGTLTPIQFAGDADPALYAHNVLLNSAAPQVLGNLFLRALGDAAVDADLLFIGSGASKSVYEGWSGYCAGKAAVDHWTRVVGAEQTRRGARRRVLCVAPGVVATAMQEEIRATAEADFPEVERFDALHRDGILRDPRDVARELWSLLDRNLPNGSILDLRTT